MSIEWDQFLVSAQVVITIQFLVFIIITLFRRSVQSFLLGYAGLVLLLSYSIYFLKTDVPDLYQFLYKGNVLYTYLYFPILIYLYFKSLNRKLRIIETVHFVIPFIQIIYKQLFGIPHLVHVSIALVLFTVYYTLAYIELRKSNTTSELHRKREWLFFIAIILHFIVDFVMIYIEHYQGTQRMIDTPNKHVHFFLINAYFLVFTIYLLTDIPFLKKYFRASKTKSALSASFIRQAVDAIEKTMSEKKPYLKPDINVDTLSSALGIKKSVFASLLQTYYRMNFNQFINTWRTEEFIERVATKEASKYDLLSLAKECGFSSKSSFYRVFKQLKGVTPSEYITST